MMEQFSLDPYEQQLLKVFDSHDRDNCGSLDKEGLTQLCQTLQLEEQGTGLIKCLLTEKNSRATFTEFKDALLALLGNMQNNIIETTKNETEKSSPDREVSPKFVYGSKKYGRRSRPRNEEPNSIFSEQNDVIKSPTNASVQRSNSQSEVSNSKKRKTNYKLKRCTSLPGNNSYTNDRNYDNSFITSSLTSEPEMVCTEEMLREAWKKLGVGDDGYLNQNELILIFDEIGLNKLAEGVIKQLSNKLSLNYDHKISFQELLEALQQDETWFDLLNNPAPPTPPKIKQTPDKLFPDSTTFQYIALGPDGNGVINTDALIEMWENVGIHSPKELIHELGFNCRKINIVELADVLEKQVKGISENTRSEYQSPHIALLQANLTLYQSEIRCFKTILEQLHAEREKLKYDVVEANNRATLLAQEVDDNHLRMEQNTLNQVKMLEHRHSDILREVTAQYSKDKEQLSNINQSLEQKINNLENETAKLKNDLLVAQKYSMNLEKEILVLNGKITDMKRNSDALTQQIDGLELDKQKRTEQEFEENEQLLTKLSALQLENSHLKDRNDEMVSEIESLSTQVATMRNKVSSTPTLHTLDQSMEENISIIYEGVGIGAKRRSDCSPTKDSNLFGITDGSPRLGKVRKFNKIKGETLDVPFTSSESGFDTELDGCDSLSASIHDSEDHRKEITRLQAKVAFLEQILVQNSIAIPITDQGKDAQAGKTILQLTNRIIELEKVIRNVKTEVINMLDRDCISCDNLKMVSQKLERTLVDEGVTTKTISVQTEPDEMIGNLEEKIQTLQATNAELKDKCNDLESCVELLRTEYEKCEDYWQSKLEEERQMNELEQAQNSEKLNDLILKMKEYEEQYAQQDVLDTRLPTIEENNLEKQFTDLEQEFEEYKAQAESELYYKDEQITVLKEKLTELALKQKQSKVEAAIQVDDLSDETKLLNKMKNFTSYVIENTSKFGEEMVPPEQPTNPQSQPNSLPVNWNFAKTSSVPSLSNAPSTSSSSLNSTPCRPKRTRKHDKNVYKKNNHDKDVKKTDLNAFKIEPEQTVPMTISSFHNLNKQRSFLEHRVRHLQLCLRQQHFDYEQALQNCWQRFNGEKADLHYKHRLYLEKFEHQKRICNEQSEKLEKNDLLVKDLYVENAYLIAKVQRLEQECHMLAHCSNSSSV